MAKGTYGITRKTCWYCIKPVDRTNLGAVFNRDYEFIGWTKRNGLPPLKEELYTFGDATAPWLSDKHESLYLEKMDELYSEWDIFSWQGETTKVAPNFGDFLGVNIDSIHV